MSLEEVAPTAYRLAVPGLEARSDGGTVTAIAGEHTRDGYWGRDVYFSLEEPAPMEGRSTVQCL